MAVLLAMSGCKRSAPEEEVPSKSSSEVDLPAAPRIAEPADVIPVAYLATTIGVMRFDRDGIAPVEELGGKPGYVNTIWTLFTGNDGRAYGTNLRSLMRIQATGIEQILDEEMYEMVVDGEGVPWWGDRNEVMRKRGAETDSLPPMDSDVDALAVTPDGTVLAASLTGLYFLEEGRWTKVDTGGAIAEGQRIKRIDALADGRVLAYGRDHVAVRDADEKWASVSKGANVYRMGPWSRSRFAFRTEEALVLVDERGLSERQPWDTQPFGFEEVITSTTDGSERTWVGTTAGLFVLREDGSIAQHWLRGALPSYVSSILVVGDGPALPSSPPPPVTFDVSGILHHEGKPAANVEIRGCFQMSLDSEGGRCDGAPERIAARTDGSGAFTFTGIVRDEYKFDVTIPGSKPSFPHHFVKMTCCAHLDPKGPHDLGVVATY